MNRKRKPQSENPSPGPNGRKEPSSAPTAPETPIPSRRNKVLLAGAVILLIGWFVFLVILALMSGSTHA